MSPHFATQPASRVGAEPADASRESGTRAIGLRVIALLLIATGLLFLLLWESPVAMRVLVGLALLVGAGVLGLQLQRLHATQRAYQLAMEAAHDGFWEWDPVTKRLHVGARLLEILGYSDNFLPDTHAWMELVHPEDRAHYNRTVAEHLKGYTPYFYCEYRVRARHGGYCWIASRGIAVRDRHGIAYQMAGSVTDITQKKQQEEQIAYLAHHDQLTALPNRFMLAEKLAEACPAEGGNGQRVGLIFIDLDRFKDINDSLGHRLGDELLQSVALRLQGRLQPGETLFRQGGDEFIVLLPGLASPAVGHARALAFLDELTSPFVIDGNLLYVGASLGLSAYPDDAADAGQLLRNADTAMYVAKRQGGGQVCAYTPEMNQRVLQRTTMEAQLRRAIERRAFSLNYQPQFASDDGRLVGAEALLRWRDGETWIPPDRFIPVAEDTGLIVQIGEWVLEEAIECLARWHRAGRVELSMAINLSPRQFWSSGLPERIAVLCARSNVPPERIELEITESMLLHAEGKHVEMLRDLRRMGFRLSLDDFGTGYSSLSYLHRLPFTALKIDRSFVASMLENDTEGPGGAGLVPAIIAMAHSLGLEVVAEGVETAGQLAVLRQLDCDIHQGFFSGRPLAEADFRNAFLRTL